MLALYAPFNFSKDSYAQVVAVVARWPLGGSMAALWPVGRLAARWPLGGSMAAWWVVGRLCPLVVRQVQRVNIVQFAPRAECGHWKRRVHSLWAWNQGCTCERTVHGVPSRKICNREQLAVRAM